jgi:Icc-related predicted phosphoesterase
MAKLRIFYATDVHGSDVTFKKFLKALRFYHADSLVLGGDITGKTLIPIIREPDETFTADFAGRHWKIRNSSELEELKQNIRNSGAYVYLTDATEMEELAANKAKVDQIFDKLVIERVKEWVVVAEERMKDQNSKLYVTAGNDDKFMIDEILGRCESIIHCEGKLISLSPQHVMISSGYANITPWKCPRDIPEEELASKIQTMVSKVNDMNFCIFNFHVPPIDSGLDTCQKLDTSVYPPKPVITGGQPMMFGGGSTAVRAAIEKHQPLLGLHGHIHESRGEVKIGKTLCVNPGSEYGVGLLRGALVTLEDNKVRNIAFTSG